MDPRALLDKSAPQSPAFETPPADLTSLPPPPTALTRNPPASASASANDMLPPPPPQLPKQPPPITLPPQQKAPTLPAEDSPTPPPQGGSPSLLPHNPPPPPPLPLPHPPSPSTTSSAAIVGDRGKGVVIDEDGGSNAHHQQEGGQTSNMSNSSNPKIDDISANVSGNGGKQTGIQLHARTDARDGTTESSGLFRRRDPVLPVTNPSSNSERRATSFKTWFRSIQGDLLPDGVIQLRVAVCGFALFGILSLLNNTMDLTTKLKFSVRNQVIVFLGIGLIWSFTAITVGVTMSARTRLGRACSHHGTRLGLLGITLLLLFNIALMLPENFWRDKGDLNSWSAAVTVVLLCLAAIGLVSSWIMSCIWGEVDNKPGQDAQ